MIVKELLKILLDGRLNLESPVFIIVNDFNGTDVPNSIVSIKKAHIGKNKEVLIIPHTVLSLNS